MAKTKVAILGGGMGGVTTAYALSSTQQLRDAYEVTIYQVGWRLGGKGASGRNAAMHQRIEEHGLHIWLGFYDNAFRVMRHCYEELGQSWTDYFMSTNDVVLYEKHQGAWTGRQFSPPPNEGIPGDGGRPDFWEIVRTALGWLQSGWEELRAQDDAPLDVLENVLDAFLPDRIESVIDETVDLLEEGWSRTVPGLLDLAAGLAEEAVRHESLCVVLRGLRDGLWRGVVEPNLDHPQIRLYFLLLDTMVTATCGMITDDLISRGFDVINDEEFTTWMRRHGAMEVTLGSDAEEGSPLIRGGYDLAFGYPKGDLHRRNIAAGVGLRGLLLMLFAYKGSFMFKMRMGMGDAIFAPLYRLLERWGVQVEFFHEVTNLGLSGDGTEIQSIGLRQQAVPVGGQYPPLVSVNGMDCWPSHPQWDELQGGSALKASGIDFERQSPPNSPSVTKVKGSDFDVVVLAIPVGALPEVCQELIADVGNPRFRLMVENSETVMTQAFQVWVSRPLEELGWQFAANSVAGSYVEPLDTYCNMTHLLAEEDWTAVPDPPRSLAYFCGVLDDRPGDDWQGTQDRAKAGAIDFLRDAYREIWPGATRPSLAPEIDWDLLVDDSGAAGPARFDAQYWRANQTGTERYVLSPSGSIDYRLAADESGYSNLFLAGDWTRNGIDAGCIEATVMSGLQAARAITGVPIEITGEDDRWLGRRRLSYVEYGGVVDAAEPFRCGDTTLYGFVLRASYSRLRALCRRVLAEPTGGAHYYEPLGNRVLLTFGHIDRITHLDPDMGFTDETQVAIWIPTAKVRKLGVLWVVDRVAWFVPYMWVDNPLTLVGGREVYGYRKNPGRIGPVVSSAGPFSLEALGGDFGPDQKAGYVPLLTVTKTQSRPDPGVVFGLLSDAGRVMWELMTEPAFLLPSAGAAGRFLADLGRQRVVEVFLKQFRDARDGRDASQQQIVEAPIRVVKFRGGKPLGHRYRFDLHRIDSHDLQGELGLRSQETSLAFEASFDFELERGRVVWEG